MNFRIDQLHTKTIPSPYQVLVKSYARDRINVKTIKCEKHNGQLETFCFQLSIINY
jgi:hypothetical protein